MDMRAGTDTALARVVKVFGAAHPHQANLFANRRANRMKVLVHDGIGIWLAAQVPAPRPLSPKKAEPKEPDESDINVPRWWPLAVLRGSFMRRCHGRREVLCVGRLLPICCRSRMGGIELKQSSPPARTIDTYIVAIVSLLYNLFHQIKSHTGAKK